jgi:hypothetical protein
LFVDGSKIRANASIDKTWTQERCEKYLKDIDEHIESILKECDDIDEKEQNKDSLVKLNEELKNKEVLKSKVEDIMKELKTKELKSINSTDSDCVKVKGRQGTHAGYNSQVVVDEKHGLIVSSDVVNETNDLHQFANQIEQANETLGHKCETGCADAGYSTIDELKKIDDQNINVIVPTNKQVCDAKPEPFDKEYFTYDSKNDCYYCPEGHRLRYKSFDAIKNHKTYIMENKKHCLACKHYGVCTNAKCGRSITRLFNEETKQKIEKNYSSKEAQTIYKLRKQKVEIPFGHIKRNLGVNAFLLKGLDGVKAEMSLFSSCFNIARMISIFGVQAFIAKIIL